MKKLMLVLTLAVLGLALAQGVEYSLLTWAPSAAGPDEYLWLGAETQVGPESSWQLFAVELGAETPVQGNALPRVLSILGQDGWRVVNTEPVGPDQYQFLLER